MIERRKDIDGLRAVAVLAVLFFHGDIAGFSGGFVGVDVFFAISGYVITRLIVGQFESEGFSLRLFYIERLFRLMPALVVTIFATTVFAVVLLQPFQLVNFGKSAIFSLIGVGNLFFYYEAGYWDFSALAKPLLHTWSLGVEQQFYVLWPIFLLAVLRCRLSLQVYVLVTSIAVTLFATVIVTHADKSLAFYLMPFRVYEFATGALCVLIERRFIGVREYAIRVRSAVGGVGLGLIAFGVAFIDESSAFPGWIAMIPVLGTALIILGNGAGVVGMVLHSDVMQYIGRRSYSLYLVHWPIFVFATQGGLYALRPSDYLMLFALTFLLASIQFYYVEVSFRRWISRRWQGSPGGLTLSVEKGRSVERRGTDGLQWFMIAASALVVIPATWILVRDGFPGRYSGPIQMIAERDYQRERDQRYRQICDVSGTQVGSLCGVISGDRVNVLVVGDSKGPDGLIALHTAFPEANFLTAIVGGCPFRVDLRNADASYAPNPACNEANEIRFSDIQGVLKSVDVVVISQLISAEVARTLPITLGWLKENGGNKIVVFGNDPSYLKPVREMIISHGRVDGIEKVISASENIERRAYDGIARSNARSMDIEWVDKFRYICQERECRAFTQEGVPFIYDWSHMSLSGAIEFGMYLKSRYPQLLNSDRDRQ